MQRLLLIEDDREVVIWMQRLLEADQYQVTVATRLDEAFAQLGAQVFNLFIVDLNLPDGSGVGALSAIRLASPDAGILMFSASEDDESIVRALEAGADDYVVKPVSPAILRARLSALQRRLPLPVDTTTASIVGDVTWDEATRRLVGPIGEVVLTPKEWHLFHVLAVRPDVPVPRASVLAAVWGYDFDPRTSVLDVALSRLRRKLEMVSSLVTVHGQRATGILLSSRGGDSIAKAASAED